MVIFYNLFLTMARDNNKPRGDDSHVKYYCSPFNFKCLMDINIKKIRININAANLLVKNTRIFKFESTNLQDRTNKF